MFRKLLKFLAAVVGLLAIYLAVLATEWLPRPDAAETAALATLEAPAPPVRGPNAFAVYWFLYHDVEPDRLDAELRRDVERSRELTAADRGADFVALDGAEPDAERLSWEWFCPPGPASCLDHVRGLDDHGASVLAEHAVVLRRLERLHDTTHLHYPFDLAGPLRIAPYGGTMHVTKMAAAKRFVDGDRPRGLAMACRDLSTWRRIGPSANLLIDGLISIAWADAYGGLVGEMLAEWPPLVPLPAECDAALAPIAAAERDQCPLWRGEFRWLQANLRRPYAETRAESADPFPKIPSRVVDVLMNSRAAAARGAVEHARGCAAHADMAGSVGDGWDWLWDPAGMMAGELTSEPSLESYRDRFRDHLDQLHALRLQAHLRGVADVDAALAALPADLLPVPVTVTVDAAARTITTRLRVPGSGEALRTLVLPPPSLPELPPAG